MRFVCQTLFDITATGVTGHCRLTRLPFTDRSGKSIINQDGWNRARNQQRNWETLTQILSLRTQLIDVTIPVIDQTGTRWMFEFETETPGVYGGDEDLTKVLRLDSTGVPMLRELNNDPDIESMLVTEGPRQNIWFAPIFINN
jgi:hypothetical protein